MTGNFIAIEGDVDIGETEKVIDGFESCGDLSEYSGDTGKFSEQSNTVQVGECALEAVAENGDPFAIQSQSGLDNYPSAGDTFEYWAKPGEGPNGRGGSTVLKFGVQDTANYYQLTLDSDNGDLEFSKVSGGSVAFTATASAGISPTSWYRVEVAWGSSGTINITVFDGSGSEQGSLSKTDSEFTSGGIIWETATFDSATTTNYFDGAVIK